MSVKEERAKVIEELNLDTRDPHTNLMAQAMALREALAAAEAREARLREALRRVAFARWERPALGDYGLLCRLCGSEWPESGPESHAADCLGKPMTREQLSDEECDAIARGVNQIPTTLTRAIIRAAYALATERAAKVCDKSAERKQRDRKAGPGMEERDNG